jgi:hypothetical protein
VKPEGQGGMALVKPEGQGGMALVKPEGQDTGSKEEEDL